MSASVQRHSNALSAAAPGVVALAFGLYVLLQPNVLFGVNGNDAGVFFGASIRLVQGFLPYRDFALVYPPGSVLLLAPVAALSRVLGTRDGIAIARCVCILVVCVNPALAALTLRSRGRVAMFAAGLALACWPFAVEAEQLELEPFVVCLCLLGVLAAFKYGAPAGGRRLFVAGLAFGFAGTIREWAVVPAIAVLICLIAKRRGGLWPYVLGAGLGFVVPTLPFFVLAPRAFVHDVFVTPLSEVPYAGFGSVSTAHRLGVITGVAAFPSLRTATGIAIAVAVGACVVALVIYVSQYRTISPVEWCIFVSAFLSVGAMLAPRKFWGYFAYFSAAFLALLVGVCVGRLNQLVSAFRKRVHARQRATLLAIVPVVVTVAAGSFGYEGVKLSHSYDSTALDPGGHIAFAVPKGECVVFDEAILAISANRFDGGGTSCPSVVDPVGFWWTEDPTHPPPYAGPSFPRDLIGSWRAWLGRSIYLVEIAPRSSYIPWAKPLSTWFNSNYRVVSVSAGAWIYVHVSSTPSAHLANQMVAAGLTAQRSKRTEQAAADYESAIRDDPYDMYGPFDLGTIYEQTGNAEAALVEYQQALRINPNFPYALYNLGVMYTGIDWVAAESYYLRVLRVQPANASANVNLGVLLVEHRETKKGLSYLKTGVHQNPALFADIPAKIRARAGLTTPK